jgi:hypothetical protein
MTMEFIAIRNALIALLGSNAAGQFRVVGFQQQAQGAKEVLDLGRSVQVFYSEGSFPKSGGSPSGPYQHEMTYRLELAVSKAAEGDIATIENPTSTPAQIATALAGMQDSAQLADESFDEMVELIYQIIMAADHIDIDLSDPVGNRWLGSVKKNQPIPRGALVVLTGEMLFTCKMPEQVTGLAGTPGEIVSTEIEIEEDDVGKAGVEADITEP